MLSNSSDDCLFYFRSGNPRDRAGLRFSAAKECRTDIKGVPHTALGREARAHTVAAIVKEQTGKQGVALLASSGSPRAIGLQNTLNFFKDPQSDDRLMRAAKPMPVVAGLTEISTVLRR